MRELIRALADISRLESGGVRINREPVAVDEIFGDIARQFEPLAKEKSLGFRAEPCHHVIETDPVLLKGIMSNLVSNAIRYTRRGNVAVECQEAATGGLQLAVSDTGIGIPADQLGTIFTDFCRLEEARTLHREGFGLGLGIVQRLSAVLGMPVSVSSALGQGTTFQIEIPPNSVLRI